MLMYMFGGRWAYVHVGWRRWTVVHVGWRRWADSIEHDRQSTWHTDEQAPWRDWWSKRWTIEASGYADRQRHVQTHARYFDVYSTVFVTYLIMLRKKLKQWILADECGFHGCELALASKVDCQSSVWAGLAVPKMSLTKWKLALHWFNSTQH